MKVKKILLVVTALLMFSSVLSAQKSVTKAVERYLIANGQLEPMSANLRPSFVKLPEMMQMKLPKGYTAESMADKYIKERFAQDFAAIISPYIMEKNVTVTEIEELSDMLESSEGRLATEHSQKMASDENMADMMAIIVKDVVSIMTKGTYVKTLVKASDERRLLFKSYYQSSGIDKMFPPLIKAQLKGKAPDTVIEKVEKYLQDNMPNLVLNASEGIMTDDDLRFYKKICDKPQYMKMIDGVTEAISNPEQLGVGMVTRYIVWIDSL